MNNYIQVYDNVLDAQSCEKLISLYQEDERIEQRINTTESKISFGQTKLSSIQKDDTIFELFAYYIGEYRKQHGITDEMWPDQYGYETPRIKKYTASKGDRFDGHVDVRNKQTSCRFLAFFIYLNNVDQGGETTFWDEGNKRIEDTIHPNSFIQIPPIQGRLLMFPPMWPWYHAGAPLVSNTTADKYLLHSYCHYL